MFTRNWYKAIAARMASSAGTFTQSVNYAGKTGILSSYSSNTINIMGNSSSSQYYPSLYTLRTSASNAGGVLLGTGTTEPALDDYCLSGSIITGYTYNAAVNYTTDDEGTTYTAVYTITNNNSAEITIGEIGLIAANAVSNAIILIERTVLDEPVTIPADGGIGQVTYTIRMNYPTA